ncbi:TraB [[Actinomadura] parvosata subsp. kistnae]|uniref:FtsK domain-containing protein n=1 Tax=[Actinomadura] parvosata subsp. kistnae TaxID=1909395 RepID=A0A1V0AAM3_9ACTN|nr:hypothetical protein [Nonomuraea sp. ATCC 55076]AQZ67251.1 hypothetical protein BKM31_42530 [Nonomuraea sp. ATCC 55076]SPL94532.1 TraB [Actinomadura parvosata subsp. kistnae]
MPGRTTTSGRELATATIEESSMAKVAAKGVSKLLTLVTPWVVGVFGFGLAAALHFILYSPEAIGAWSSVVTVCVIVLTGVTYGTSHARGPWGKTHTTASTFLAGAWTVAVVNLGPWHPVLWRLGVLGGITMALSWNIRSVIRMKGWDDPGTVTDPLSFLFGQGAQRAGMKEIEARTVKATAHKVEGEVQLDHGRHIADDLQKKVAYIESGIPLPPGSITTTIDPDDASKAKLTISDPRVMKHPIIWPGPSRPGLSIADPIRLGLWQDLDEIEYVIVGHHLQVMGQTGSGKSIGGAWNFLAEVVTRYDVAVFAGDITKGDQTLGPMREALHRFETSKAGVKAMLADLQAQIKPRTNYLAGKGLQKWVKGCGLTYWIVWLEEFPDIFDALTDAEQDKFLSMLKAIRSAGGTIVMSLQRSDYSQMPTIARGQLAKMCFGVDSPADASFGLSERQQDAGARPELWTNAQPGMAYLDAPSIPDARIAMPLRTFAWGINAAGTFDDEAANTAMREHAARWPAAGKKVDPTTARLSVLAGGAHPRATWPVELEEPHQADPDAEQADDDEEDVRNVAAEYLATDDPDPDIIGDLDDAIPDLPDGQPPLTFAPPEHSMTPQQRGQALLERLQELWDDGARDFSSGDLKPLWESTDISRSWCQKQLKRLVEAGVLGGYDDEAQRYLMPDRPEIEQEAA